MVRGGWIWYRTARDLFFIYLCKDWLRELFIFNFCAYLVLLKGSSIAFELYSHPFVYIGYIERTLNLEKDSMLYTYFEAHI